MHSALSENWRWHDPYAAVFTSAYWVDVDVALSGIVRQRVPSPLRLVGRQPISIFEDCILEGVGAVGFAPNETTGAAGENRFAVRISRNGEDHARQTRLEDYGACQVIWDQRGDRSWRSTMYISDFMLRHIVEFFVTKRIDSVRFSLQVNVFEDAAKSVDSLDEWSQPAFLSDRHTRCRLLSIYTSKGNVYAE
ncbi:MAG: hypothetical protein JO288_14815 [Hyphomicrobiales bacterium]|nr:hypothetical protein [Hyphomicrobiales bacterium]